MIDVREYFYALSRETLGIEHEINKKVFMLEEMSFSKASNIGSVAYYDKNFNNWTQKKR